MTVNYTTNLALGQPVTGTESGTWGDDVNNSVTSYLDIAIAGGLSVTVTVADVTLVLTQGTSSATNIGSTTAQYAILNVSGAMTAARNLILPSSSRQYVINNNTTGGFALTVKGSATSGVTMVNGEKAHVFWNGSDYAKLSNTPGGAGTFSSITNTGLTATRLVYSTTGGLETDSANLTFDGTNLTLLGGTANGVAYLNGSKVLTTGTALTFDGTNFSTTGTATATKLIPTGTSVTGNGMYLPATNSVGISTAGTNAVYIDASQNLGLGVTPSAWSSNRKVVAIGGTVATVNYVSTYGENAYNCYTNGTNYIYQNSTYAGEFNFNIDTTGGFSWKLAASGTAGNAITFTQAMTLDASGNLGIGTSSPSQKLTVNGGIANNYVIYTDDGTYGRLILVTDSTANKIVSYTTANGAYRGLNIYTASATPTVTLDDSGNLLVGTTSVTASPVTGVQLANGGSGTIGGVFVGHATGTATGNYYATFSYNGGIIGSITQSGTTAVLYNLTSDQRLKENIQDAAPASDLIDAIQVRQFDWKSDGSHQRYGFIAQELVTVAPEAVHQPADPEEMMAVDYSKLVPMLVKEIQSLRKRLADAGIA